MSFSAKGDRIFVMNNSGKIVFDTNKKMPFIHSQVAGSIFIPSRAPCSKTTTSHDIATLQNNADILFCIATISGGTNYPWTDKTLNFSGSILTNLGWAARDNAWRIIGARTLTFSVSSNKIILLEDYFNDFSATDLTSFTLTYRIFAGSIDG